MIKISFNLQKKSLILNRLFKQLFRQFILEFTLKFYTEINRCKSKRQIILLKKKRSFPNVVTKSIRKRINFTFELIRVHISVLLQYCTTLTLCQKSSQLGVWQLAECRPNMKIPVWEMSDWPSRTGSRLLLNLNELEFSF